MGHFCQASKMWWRLDRIAGADSRQKLFVDSLPFGRLCLAVPAMLLLARAAPLQPFCRSRAGARAPVHPTSTVRHGRRLTAVAPASLRSAPRCALRISRLVPGLEPPTAVARL